MRSRTSCSPRVRSPSWPGADFPWPFSLPSSGPPSRTGRATTREDRSSSRSSWRSSRRSSPVTESSPLSSPSSDGRPSRGCLISSATTRDRASPERSASWRGCSSCWPSAKSFAWAERAGSRTHVRTARGGSTSPGERGAAAHRARAARRARAQHLAHQRPGGRRAPPHGRAARAGPHGAHRDQAGEQGGAAASCDRCSSMLRSVDEDAPRTPTPGLDRLDDLVDRAGARRARRRRSRSTATRRELPAEVDAGRVSHRAGGAHQRRSSRRAVQRDRPRRLRRRRPRRSQVDDDGSGATPRHGLSAAGSGIAGMRERAAALGGRLEAGPRPGGGFRVRARAPDGRRSAVISGAARRRPGAGAGRLPVAARRRGRHRGRRRGRRRRRGRAS